MRIDCHAAQYHSYPDHPYGQPAASVGHAGRDASPRVWWRLRCGRVRPAHRRRCCSNTSIAKPRRGSTSSTMAKSASRASGATSTSGWAVSKRVGQRVVDSAEDRSTLTDAMRGMFPDYYDYVLAHSPFENAIRLAPQVCVGPIQYIGQALVERDIAEFEVGDDTPPVCRRLLALDFADLDLGERVSTRRRRSSTPRTPMPCARNTSSFWTPVCCCKLTTRRWSPRGTVATI